MEFCSAGVKVYVCTQKQAQTASYSFVNLSTVINGRHNQWLGGNTDALCHVWTLTLLFEREAET